MGLSNIRIAITIIATLTAIIFIILAYIFPEHSIVILTIETILLPTIYIVGNHYAEDLIERRYMRIIQFIKKESSELNEKYIKQIGLNNRIQAELKALKNGKEK